MPPSFAPQKPAVDVNLLREEMAAARQAEPYGSFEELARQHNRGTDYSIELILVKEAQILIAAWHGGEMERGSDLLARAISRDTFNYYAFNALKKKPEGAKEGNHPLHITSAKFNEPGLTLLAKLSYMVIGIHCCNTTEDPCLRRIFIGGGIEDFNKQKLINHLRKNGFNAGIDLIFPGKHSQNPCNQGKTPGFQIEIPQAYMDELLKDSAQFSKLASVLSDFFKTIEAPQNFSV